MKNSLKIALALTTLAGGLGMAVAEIGTTQSAQEALERLLGIAKIMREKGPTETATLLNGHSMGGTGNTKKGKSAEDEDNQQAMMGPDSESGIICVTNADGKEWRYSVHQLEPMLVGKSAVSGEHIWRDGVGIAMVEEILKEMRAQKSHKVSVKYADKTPGVNEGREGQPELVNKKMLAVNKAWLLSDNHQHAAGEAVPGDIICATAYFQSGATDEGDFNRLTAPDMPDRHAAGAGTPHHHHAAKKAAAPAKDAKKEEPKKEEPKKEEPKKEEPKKEEPKKEEPKKEEPKKEEPKAEEKK